MEVERRAVSLPCSPLRRCSIIVHEDEMEFDNIDIKVCPLCKSSLKLFQMNNEEKIMICPNKACAWPFGFDNYHVFKVECDESFSKTDACSDTGSIASTSDWSELDRIMLNSPMSLASSSRTPTPSLIGLHDSEKIQRIKASKKKDAQLQDNIKQIHAFNKALNDNDPLEISNDKWIKNIAQMQQRSGVQLLKKHEIKKAKKMLPTIDGGDLKIDIDPSKQMISLEIAIPSEE